MSGRLACLLRAHHSHNQEDEETTRTGRPKEVGRHSAEYSITTCQRVHARHEVGPYARFRSSTPARRVLRDDRCPVGPSDKPRVHRTLQPVVKSGLSP